MATSLGVSDAAVRETPRSLPLDRFHTGVRLATLGWWLAATAALYFAGLAVFSFFLGEDQGWVWLPWLIAVLLLSQFIGRWGERQLLQRWPSGRKLDLAPGRLTLTDKGQTHTMDFARLVNYWRWQFVIRNRRGGRVANGHFCCAIRLLQDDVDFCVYAFLPPEQYKALSERYKFYELRPSNDAQPKAGVLGGRDAAFLNAERLRWDHGAELEAADFDELLAYLKRHRAEFEAVMS